MMDKITVQVGSVVTGNSGLTRDTRRPVEIEGERVATYEECGWDDRGGVTDTRGVIQTLYRTSDGRWVIHVEDWSRWVGEPTVSTLHEVTLDDLGPNGRFEMLGREAGLSRPLTLDEALREQAERETA